MHYRKALEAKAALYDRLCGGEGVRGGGSDDSEEEGGEGRYMVDFTRKIVEEVCMHVSQCACVSRGMHRLLSLYTAASTRVPSRKLERKERRRRRRERWSSRGGGRMGRVCRLVWEN